MQLTAARPLSPVAASLLLAMAMVAGAAAAFSGTLAGAGIVLAGALAGAAARLRGPLPALGLVLGVSCLQNIVAAVLAHWLSRPELLGLLAVKEAMALGAGFAGFWLIRARLRPVLADGVAATLILWVLARTLAGEPSLGALASARQAVVLPMLWLCGRGIDVDRADLPRVLGMVLRLGFALAVLGFLERFVLGDTFWAWLGMSDLFFKKGLGVFVSPEGVPINFTSWDLTTPMRRLVGPLAEPTSMAHLLALPVGLAFGARWLSGNWRTQLRVGGVPALALVLTMGKSGVVTALAGIGFGLAGKSRRNAALLAGVVVAGLLAGAAAYAASPGLRRNVVLHLQGFACPFEVSATGAGLGTAGDYALAMRDATQANACAASESFVAVLAAQTGPAGAGLYILFALAVVVTLAGRPGLPHADDRNVLAGLVLGTWLTSFVSETPAGFLAGGLTLLVAGSLARAWRVEGPDLPV